MCDEDLQEKLKQMITNANEFVQKQQSVQLEIREYNELLKMKYDEEGRKAAKSENSSRNKSTILMNWFDKIISKSPKKIN